MSEVPEARIPERRNRNTWIIVLIVAAVLLTLLCACLAAVAAAGAAGWFAMPGRVGLVPGIRVGEVEANRALNQTFTVAKPIRVNVNNNVGRVQIRGTNTDQVVVRAQVRAWGTTQADAERIAEQVNVTIQQMGNNQISVTATNPPQAFRRSPTVEITIDMPMECALTVQANVGEVDVQGIVGSAQVHTDVGKISVLGLTLRENSEITSGVGEVEVSLPRDSAFRLDAQTSVGEINSDFPFAGRDEQRRGPGDRLSGQVGEGPMATLTLRANTGAINLRAE